MTFSNDEAEKDINVTLMAANAAQKSAHYAQNGDYERSRANRSANMSFFRKNALPNQQHLVSPLLSV